MKPVSDRILNLMAEYGFYRMVNRYGLDSVTDDMIPSRKWVHMEGRWFMFRQEIIQHHESNEDISVWALAGEVKDKYKTEIIRRGSKG